MTESAIIRRENILHYFSTAAEIGVDSIWLGRDPGYLGARRTGIAFTDEAHLSPFSFSLSTVEI